MAAGEKIEPQVIATNVDAVLIVTSANSDFNLRRLERYLTAVRQSGARAIIVVNKADLIDDPSVYIDQLAEIRGEGAEQTPVVLASALTGSHLDEIRVHLGPGRTIALVGSSGVGKSTLINGLLGAPRQTTGAIRADDERGRHTTTHRQLLIFEGGIVIDTPGMRELKPWVDRDAAAAALAPDGFADVDALVEQCRFRDCLHGQEPGCAVRAAIDAGQLTPVRLEAWRKLTIDLAAAAAKRAASGAIAERRRSGRVASRAMRQVKRDRGGDD
jgi:ribosome biogenesis GTPase / thiamine phosphate phosphatase